MRRMLILTYRFEGVAAESAVDTIAGAIERRGYISSAAGWYFLPDHSSTSPKEEVAAVRAIARSVGVRLGAIAAAVSVEAEDWAGEV